MAENGKLKKFNSKFPKISFIRLATFVPAIKYAAHNMLDKSKTLNFSHFCVHSTMLHYLSLGNAKRTIFIFKYSEQKMISSSICWYNLLHSLSWSSYNNCDSIFFCFNGTNHEAGLVHHSCLNSL